MSLLICSSAQDKYESSSNMKVALVNENLLPVSSQGQGLQNPNSFTNNINPVMEIPANSQVALKDISFSKKAVFKVGVNVSMSLHIGEFLDERYVTLPERSLYDITSMPFPVPLQPGDYNERTFANMVNGQLDEYISYPDMVGNIMIEPSSEQYDPTEQKGYTFRITKGNETGRPADRKTEMITAIRHYSGDTAFVWDAAAQTYTSSDDEFETNEGILTNIPLSLNNGRVIWDVAGATGGFRVGLIRPSLETMAAPDGFNLAYGAHLNTFNDICVEYDIRTDAGYADTEKTLRIYHAVVQDGIKCMREVQYYANVAADFDPGLNTYLPAKAPMYRGTATTRTDIGGDPTHIKIIVCGEDVAVLYIFGGVDNVLTDSRLCIKANVTAVPASVAGVPTRNRFIKPTGINTWAMYPIMSLKTNGEVIQLDEWTGVSGGDAGQDYDYPKPALTLLGDNAPVKSTTGSATAGSSVYGRGRLSNNMGVGDIVDLADTARPYDSSSAEAQKQYVGLDGPTAATPPVREGEGNPYLPATATGDGVVAYTCALVLIPPEESVGDWKTKGVYSCKTSDVSELLGFRGLAMVAQARQGESFLLANDPGEDGNDDPPTDTDGAFFGWNVSSTTDPTYGSGPIFVRCPTLTHQSYNFGKGIPSKIIASLPADSFSRDTSAGWGYFAPSEMTYLDLNNPHPLHFNDITLEIVDKNEEVLTILDKSTTITLHFKQK
jgi:hypothetical protein